MASLQLYLITTGTSRTLCAALALMTCLSISSPLVRAGGDPARTLVNQPVSAQGDESLLHDANPSRNASADAGAEQIDAEKNSDAAAPSPGSGAIIPDRTIRRPSPEKISSTTAQPAALQLNTAAESWRLGGLVPLIIVLGVMAGAYYVVKRFAPGAVKADGGLLSVVSRAALSPKHSIALVRVGRRFVLVGISGDNIASLSEVTDEEEVADLVAATGTSRSEMDTGFSDLLGGEAKLFDEADAPCRPGTRSAASGDRESATEGRGIDRTSPLGLPSLAALRKKLKSLDARA